MQCLAKSLSKSDGKDEAMFASLSGKGKKECKPHGVCWNCGEKGHFKDKCPKPLKDMKQTHPRRAALPMQLLRMIQKVRQPFLLKVTRNLMMIFLSFALSPTPTLKVLILNLKGIARVTGFLKLVMVTKAVAGKPRSYLRLTVVSATC